MYYPGKLVILSASIFVGILLCHLTANAQTRLSYDDLNTALNVKLPNRSFKTKPELISWLIVQVRNRKVDSPLTRDTELKLRSAGATDELIGAILANSPPVPETIVNVGELTKRAVNLVKPEYPADAQKAGITGLVTLELSLDEQGRVISTKTIAGLPGGLTEQAIAAAKTSTFTPATVNGKPAKAVGTITYNFKINRIDVAATLATADDLRNKSNCAAAIPEYTKIVSLDTKQVKALAGRGMCYVMNGSYDLAIVDLDAAANLGPPNDQIAFFRGLANDFKGDPRTAAKYYEQAIDLNPELDKWILMECVFVDRKQLARDQLRAYGDDLVKACSTSLQSASEFLSSLIYLKRGIGYRLKGDFDRSIADLESSRRQNPRFLAVQGQLQISYNARGLAHYDKKEYDEAIEDVTTAINLNPQNPTPFINRCAFYVYGTKKYDLGISDCTAAIRLTTRSSMAYNHRGYAYEMKKDVKSAIADYQKALDIDPQNQVARANLNRVQKPSLKN